MYSIVWTNCCYYLWLHIKFYNCLLAKSSLYVRLFDDGVQQLLLWNSQLRIKHTTKIFLLKNLKNFFFYSVFLRDYVIRNLSLSRFLFLKGSNFWGNLFDEICLVYLLNECFIMFIIINWLFRLLLESRGKIEKFLKHFSYLFSYNNS